MNDAPAREYKPRLLPSSPIELEQFVQETLGRFIHHDKGERAAIYSRLSVFDPKVNSFSMEMQPDRSENQIIDLISQLKIPECWYETILAYYLDDIGMIRFELEGYNLRQELSRQRELFRLGHIAQVEYEQAINRIERELHKLQPSTQSEASKITPLFKDFPAIWSQINLTERRAILKTIYVGIYFDSGSSLRKALLQSPFDKLLAT